MKDIFNSLLTLNSYFHIGISLQSGLLQICVQLSKENNLQQATDNKKDYSRFEFPIRIITWKSFYSPLQRVATVDISLISVLPDRSRSSIVRCHPATFAHIWTRTFNFLTWIINKHSAIIIDPVLWITG